MAQQIVGGTGEHGALAGLSEDHHYHALGQHFSKLRIGHAFPVAKGSKRRPQALPRSWGFAGKTLFDHAQLKNANQPFVVDSKAPKYIPDWKEPDFEEALKKTAWPDVPTELRIRTQIHEDRRAAAENRLFGIVYRRTDKHDWLCDVDFDGSDADKAVVFTQLASALRNGLGAIGRGGAFATVIESEVEERIAPVTGTVVMTLQTPALLRRPDDLSSDLTPAYQAAFAAIGIKAKLEAVFIDERLRGASFMAKRLPPHIDYRPWLLTEAGSVFVFQNVGEADCETLSQWLATGLPVPETTLQFYGLKPFDRDLWQYCPWLPENGYGEVRFGATLEQPAFNAEAVEGVVE